MKIYQAIKSTSQTNANEFGLYYREICDDIASLVNGHKENPWWTWHNYCNAQNVKGLRLVTRLIHPSPGNSWFWWLIIMIYWHEYQLQARNKHVKQPTEWSLTTMAWRGNFPRVVLPYRSLWRNRLARSAVNRKVGGSSPPRDVHF